jgi:hypothetical protein
VTTVSQAHAAIVLTSTARTAFLLAGTNADELMVQISTHIVELKRIYAQFILIHPSSDGDATNAAALAAIQASL